jgi:carbonic anhydrase
MSLGSERVGFYRRVMMAAGYNKFEDKSVRQLKTLFDNNRQWAKAIKKKDPQFFLKLSHLQTPRFLWIGCSDSRVPANEITGLLPGELFVHRNVANIVVHTDLNCLSVVQYAVEVLKVENIIVCGHYGCGGVKAAFEVRRLGLIDNWLRHITDVNEKYKVELKRIKNKGERFDRLCELNVLEQADNICQTTVVQDTWGRGRPLSVHALIYDLRDGLLRGLSTKSSGSGRA